MRTLLHDPILNRTIRPMLYDKDGDPLDEPSWAKLASDDKYPVIEVAYLAELHTIVSTVWTGIDYSFGRDALPLMFETAVMDNEGNVRARRYYSNEFYARRGHADIVKELHSDKDTRITRLAS